ncbi:MAG: hypothetical protein COT71_04390 [Candidatus Andersenbacteria bacterium CG10_big_fil_rev_8_21_14_0_10_54_11]|uniref:Prepilin-type cleavage/methylation domain-containing protein n=1 Tax=Candidatus Andersenbacteria bacterium CG10_big_fil_rev_8_21_14_0_10_54_11 TaxID=1974485 RepID=A0A2M6WY77_9BACT|nr:MAG: hypothetical protein COT71_04390 [Candidatus Andersenbacteria bacterium CG10_big_fil_rev_8_21_14_0_10_54_11]
MTINKQQGFTLIELLVVIAIIGILAALVLVSLGNARSKAQDARIKSDVAQLRTLAEIHFDSVGNYDTFDTCFSAATPSTSTECKGGIGASVQSLKSDMDTANGAAAMAANAVGNAFCLYSGLASTASDKVCVDSTGTTVISTAANPCATTACAP